MKKATNKKTAKKAANNHSFEVKRVISKVCPKNINEIEWSLTADEIQLNVTIAFNDAKAVKVIRKIKDFHKTGINPITEEENRIFGKVWDGCHAEIANLLGYDIHEKMNPIIDIVSVR
ncbi:MAG: hypothetical protein WCS52_07955 [bacterium]